MEIDSRGSQKNRPTNQNEKTLQPFELQGFESGTPEGTRTPNLLIRSQTLYPIELRVRCGKRGAEKSPV